MRKILIIGASGFIGKKVADYLSHSGDFDVIRYSRFQQEGYFSCLIGDSDWVNMIDSCEAIINCSGVGLAKLKKIKELMKILQNRLSDLFLIHQTGNIRSYI
ncbi:NAD-dependent epimerase/dehydratase family protein [Xenorhabdus bovienii]|uniref:NAD-dependent epimerase/dehydratase domain-containing protein n=1 Tax=Xenorhabdus bovienii TaxID=40576 RepID=A0A0B6XDW5_XENBV|nr:NAD-dependent epimerase/dehydratase family protein [Xenorhabdus bovienii]CDM91331.1 protein of unknown function [Xenorhabdus bovienii]